ncbi:MAG: hypothetical protein M3155_04485 [Actinomycetota bacterium]|nr:hypothetical protein [Actinomycetota bacterium]
MSRRTAADIAAGLAAVAVLGLGGLVVVKPAVDHFSDVYRGNPFTPRSKQEKVVKETPNQPTVTTTTTKPESGSFVERALGDSGLLMLRIGIVVLAAFLAGAAIQRAALGEFALEVGPLKLPDVAAASKTAIADLTTKLQRLEEETTARDAQTRALLAEAVRNAGEIDDPAGRAPSPPGGASAGPGA